jgi:hypothetical protein
MRLRNMKFTVLMVGVAVVLPISLLVSLLMTWQSPNRAIAGEQKEPYKVQQSGAQGGSNGTAVQGQARNTNQVPTSDIKPTTGGAAPLGTEDGVEELRQRIQEGRANVPIPRATRQQADSAR